MAVEYGREPAQALGDVDTERRLPSDLDPVVRVHALDGRRVARLFAKALGCVVRLLVGGG